MSRDFALVGTRLQWEAAAHRATHVDPGGRVVLDWTEVGSADPAPFAPPPPVPGGMAFDSGCRLFRSVPREGRVERVLWRPERPAGEVSAPVELFRPVEGGAAGDFRPGEAPRALRAPLGIAVDSADRLFIAEADAGRVLVYDLWSRTLLRRVSTPVRPLDVAAHGGRAAVLLEGGGALLLLTARGPVRRVPLHLPLDEPVSRIGIPPCGCGFTLLTSPGTEEAGLVGLKLDVEGGTLREAYRIPASYGTAIAFAGDRDVVVARRPAESFLRFDWKLLQPRPPLRARGYAGEGIVRTPDGRIAFPAEGGLRHAIELPVRHVSRGVVIVGPLDGGEYRRAWGRVFVDACAPRGTALRVSSHTSDEEGEGPVDTAEAPPRALLARRGGSEIPWASIRAGRGEERTFEAPVAAPPGRYLWLALELIGNTRATPAVAAVRVEKPGHELTRRLPAIFTREPGPADFLHRFLAGPDDLAVTLAGLADARHILLDPRAAPASTLPWLAGFLGLLLDERWSERAKRTAIAEAHWLFRFRGTVPGLRRFLEIALESRVHLIEHFKLRGQGSALLGDTGEAFTTSVLGAGFRVGGQVGTTDEPVPLDGSSLADAFATRAHRFTVIVPASLDRERRDVARWILDLHRPAHTVYDLCTVDSGMRVGRGTHVGLSSVIGHTGGFVPLRLGDGAAGAWGSTIGRGAILGRPRAGTRVDSARVGRGTETG